MDLLIEDISAQAGNIITEAEVNGNNVSLQGIFMQAEIKNRNGRTYPLSEMTNEVSRAQGVIKEHGGIFGELDHPQGITINLDRVSHVIKELYMDGSNVKGKMHLLDTPMGKIGKELARSGVRYGVSSRAAGQVNESGIVSGFTFVTIDLVATPSAMSAYPLPVYEHLDTMQGKKVYSLAESLQHDESAQKYFKKEFKKFFEELMNK